ncbi:MAG: HigA family addiction module antitoxin [Desulfovibrionaceae bacterium]|nr:HigA family addiction module antitoxin [Desulfovibrionaceae bacterium]
MPPIHPGEFIEEILLDTGMSQAALARAIGVSPMRVSHVVRGERPLTADLALRLGRAFGQGAQYWINLQNAYDIKIAERKLGRELKRVCELTLTPALP